MSFTSVMKMDTISFEVELTQPINTNQKYITYQPVLHNKLYTIFFEAVS